MVLRWGFLGSGKIARDFACSMLAVDGCEIVSVVSVLDALSTSTPHLAAHTSYVMLISECVKIYIAAFTGFASRVANAYEVC